MIYELALVTKAELGEEGLSKVMEMIRSVVQEFAGEVLVEDDWGVKAFAQDLKEGATHGHFVYYIFKCSPAVNAELIRRFGINEHILRHLIVKLGEDRHQANLVKNYKSPFSKKYHGSLIDDASDGFEGEEMDERRKFSRRKMSKAAKAIMPDWKDPKTFNWMINEFGKISPARISGAPQKHQRSANRAIKRARTLGITSFTTSGMMHG